MLSMIPVFDVCYPILFARNHLDEATKRYPQSTLLNKLLKPTIEASMEIHGDNPNREEAAEEAIRLLKPALHYEDSMYGNVAKYIRGQAFLILGKGDDAAREFQQMFDIGRRLP